MQDVRDGTGVQNGNDQQKTQTQLTDIRQRPNKKNEPATKRIIREKKHKKSILSPTVQQKQMHQKYEKLWRWVRFLGKKRVEFFGEEYT